MSQAAAEQIRTRWRLHRPDLTILTGPDYQTGTVVANRLGLQLARIAAVNLAFRARRRPVDADIREYVQAYERDGVVVLENFLPDDVFATVRAECLAAHEAGLFMRESIEDNSVIEDILVVKKHADALPVTWGALSRHEQLLRIVAAITRLPAPKTMKLDIRYMSKTSAAPAPTRLVGTHYLHADVHYPSAKAWLFLHDIDEANGAFVYAKGSQKMRLGRLLYEYWSSIRVAKAKRDGTMGTSIPANIVRAPTERHLRLMHIAESTLGGKANTLVIANVGGFHRRGDPIEGRRREQIQFKFLDRPGARA
jgi:Phytanoyl-CoA dioxygenase (PhyH)